MSDFVPMKPIDNGKSWAAEFQPGSRGEKAIESLGLRPDHLRHDLLAFDNAHATLARELLTARAALDGAQQDRDHWKANHDEMVERNRLLRTRTDLTTEQIAERLGWKAALDAAGVELAGMREALWQVQNILNYAGTWMIGCSCQDGRHGEMQTIISNALSASASRPGSHSEERGGQ